MPLNFPENPTVNQIYVYNGIRWRWNGYGWTPAGISGGVPFVPSGISGDYVIGITGGVGITLSSPSGVVEVTLKLDEPNIGPTNTERFNSTPVQLFTDTGFAKRVAKLNNDGSISFEYMRNYDIFRDSDFLFDINTLTSTIGNIQLVGNTTTSVFSLFPYNFQISYRGTAVNVLLTLVNSLAGQGFPISVAPNANVIGFNAGEFLIYKNLTYNSAGTNNDFQRFIFGVTGQNDDGSLRFVSRNYDLYFANNIFYGSLQNTNLTDNEFATAVSNLQLSSNLQTTRGGVVNITVPFNQNNPFYFYYAYPARLAYATFRDNTTNIEGGFQLVNNNITYTNSKGYTETYFLWRTENPNLGTISITVT